MEFIFKPTLEHIALMKLLSLLWNQHDIRILVEEFSNTTTFLHVDNNLPFRKLFEEEGWTCEKEEKWQTIEDRVVEKIPIMQTSLKDKAIGCIKPIGLQVLRWMEYHRKCFCLNLKLPSEFCWTLQGTIDRKKTAEVLVKNEDIDIITRYRLACIYCLENDIYELWNKVPENLKYIQPNLTDHISNPREFSELAFHLFWKRFKKGKLHWKKKIRLRISVNTNCNLSPVLKTAAIMANKAATEYFLQKIHPSGVFLEGTAVLVMKMYNEIDSTISDPPREYCSEVLCFLLSQMNDVQKLSIIRKCPSTVLLPLLDWPWQTFFVEIASHVYRTVPENEEILFTVAVGIVRKVKLGYKDCNYRKLFGEIWQQLSHDAKCHNINGGNLTGMVELLQEIKDRENIKLMLQYVRNTEKNEFFFSNVEINMCKLMATHEEWDVLKFFVQMCVTSRDEMIEFKEKVMQHVTRELLKDKWDKFSQVLDGLVCGFDKRKNVNEGECSTTKRLCKSDNACEEKS